MMTQRRFTSSIGRSLVWVLVLFIWATPALATWGFNPLYGPLFFIRGSEVYHDGTTWVEGGAEGSTALIGSGSRIRQTYWFFVDGTNLWLRNPGETVKPAKVTTPGDYITTTWRNTNGTVRTADRKWLNHYMEHLSINSKGGGRRAPYLMGKGWVGGAEPAAELAHHATGHGGLNLARRPFPQGIACRHARQGIVVTPCAAHRVDLFAVGRRRLPRGVIRAGAEEHGQYQDRENASAH